MQVYLVGGAVRDTLLGQSVHDKDFVVVGALPQELLDLGFSQVGADFPVFLHPHSHFEYALARTERKLGTGHRGFCVDTLGVSLTDDLSRRDLTINAMAIQVTSLFDDTPLTGQLIDPHGGQHDLQHKVLRHLSPAFAEDPLRILRVARFYARLCDDGFLVAPETQALMTDMANKGELSHLSRERIWAESAKALGEKNSFMYFKLLFELGILSHLLPTLSKLWQNPALKEQTFFALRHAQSASLRVKFALLIWAFVLTDDKIACLEETARTLVLPNDIKRFAHLFLSHHQHLSQLQTLDGNSLLTLLEDSKAHKGDERIFELITAHHLLHDTNAKSDLTFIKKAINAHHAITINDIDPSLTGKAIGEQFTQLRTLLLETLNHE